MDATVQRHAGGAPRALVVHESMFGNTTALAQAVERGLRQAGIETAIADVLSEPDPFGYDLLVVGAPTHAFSLSRPRTRADAVRQGADPAHAASGLREWLIDLPRTSGRELAVFDSRVAAVRRLPGSAAGAALRVLRGKGYVPVVRPMHFLVVDVQGPLVEGELERAARWGGELAVARVHQPRAGTRVRP